MLLHYFILLLQFNDEERSQQSLEISARIDTLDVRSAPAFHADSCPWDKNPTPEYCIGHAPWQSQPPVHTLSRNVKKIEVAW